MDKVEITIPAPQRRKKAKWLRWDAKTYTFFFLVYQKFQSAKAGSTRVLRTLNDSIKFGLYIV